MPGISLRSFSVLVDFFWCPTLLRHGPVLDRLGLPGLQMLIAGDGPLRKPNGT